MNLLLDTSILIWWLAGSNRLSQTARSAIADPTRDVYVSAASAWEMAIKVGLGKLDVPSDLATWLPAELVVNRFRPLPIAFEHGLAVETLPPYHNDPFDRLLIAQATVEGLIVVTTDAQFEPYAVEILRG